ncbi:hypothetical protein Tco_1465395 [Tanacetum coccineum]
MSDESLVIPLEELRVDDNLHFVEEPVEVMDCEIKQLKKSCLSIIKVNKVQVMGTLDDRLLKSYRYKDLRALHFGILLCCEIFTFQVEQFKPMGFSVTGTITGATTGQRWPTTVNGGGKWWWTTVDHRRTTTGIVVWPSQRLGQDGSTVAMSGRDGSTVATWHHVAADVAADVAEGIYPHAWFEPVTSWMKP